MPQTAESFAWMKEPWTCPGCDKTIRIGGKGPHERWCGGWESRFWAKVNKTEGCWLWTGGKNEWGYGLTVRRGQKNLRAHRVSYELSYGPIPAGKLALHNCHTPACVRPDHLRLGTDAENTADKVAAGRALRGESQPRSKLTDEDVRAILREFKRIDGRTSNTMELAKRYGVWPNAIRAIVLGTAWTHIQRLPQIDR